MFKNYTGSLIYHPKICSNSLFSCINDDIPVYSLYSSDEYSLFNFTDIIYLIHIEIKYKIL